MASINTAPVFPLGDGTVITTLGIESGGGDVLVQADGKIVVAGYADIYDSESESLSNVFTLFRYNTDGSLDASFGDGGIVITAIGSGGYDHGHGVAIQADGKILVVGSSDSNFALARYNSDGSLDTSFSGDGKLTTTFKGDGSGSDVIVQADGKILVVGTVGAESYVGDFALVRYNADGSLDTSFSGDGKLTTNFGGDESAESVIVQADGKILVAGYGEFQSYLARYNPDGSLDTGFSGDGKLTITATDIAVQAGDIAVQADGKILVTGYADDAFALFRYNTDGSLDQSFAHNGMVMTRFGKYNSSANSITVQADGKILVAGDYYYYDDDWGQGFSYFALARYNPDGSLDASFSGDGKLTTNFDSVLINEYDSAVWSSAYNVVVQADGKIIVQGAMSDGIGGNSVTALARYNPDGSLDKTFDPPENGLGSAATYIENNAPVILDNNVSVTDAQLAKTGNYAGASLTLSRHGGAESQDVFAATGRLGAFVEGGDLELAGMDIGKVIKDSDGILTLNFNANATQARVNETLSSIAYANTGTGAALPTSVKIDWTFADGNTGAQGTGGELSVRGSTTVTIDHLPTIVNPVSDKTATEEAAFSFTIPVGTASDPDAFDSLRYVAVQADGSPLPAWLHFDSPTRTFSGMPGYDDVGAVDVKIIASDNSGGSVSDIFHLTVLPRTANTLVVTNLNDYGPGSLREAIALSHNRDTITFDPSLSGGTIKLDAKLLIDKHIILDADLNGDHRPDITLSGDANDNGKVDAGDIRVLEIAAGTKVDVIGLTLTGGYVSGQRGRNAADGDGQDGGDGSDALGAALYNAGQLRLFDSVVTQNTAIGGNGGSGGNGYNGGNGTVNIASGPGYYIEYWYGGGGGGAGGAGGDGGDAFAGVFNQGQLLLSNTEFSSNISTSGRAGYGGDGGRGGVNQVAGGTGYAGGAGGAPGQAGSGSISGGAGGNVSQAGQDGGTANTYQRISGMPYPSASHLLGGGGGGGGGGKPGEGSDIGGNAWIINTPIDLAPKTALQGVVGKTLNFDLGLTGADTDEQLVWRVANLPAWLKLDPVQHTLIGTPTSSGRGTLSLHVEDGRGGYDDLSLVWRVTTADLVNQIAKEDTAFAYTLPRGAFSDLAGTLTYSASLTNGAVLPSWLSFDAATGKFSGTPQNAQVGTLNLKVTATDPGGTRISDTFQLVIANTNDAPTLAHALTNQNATAYKSFAFTIPINTFADADKGDTLTYSASLDNGKALPTWLHFDAATRTFSGKPSNLDLSPLTLKVIVRDSHNASASTTFTLTVASNPNVTGDSGNNYLYGTTAADTLNGGAGNDTLKGGQGDDTYVVDSAGDSVIEFSGQGNDSVRSTISYSLTGNVENLILIGTDAIDGSGNSLANTLRGNDANNVLDGKGGADSLKGGKGDDTYIVDTASDTITENGNEGTDSVLSSVGYTLALNVEHLTLTGSTAVKAIGNSLANTLTGNDANNLLDGKAGADSLRGGLGDDTYVIDNVGDTIDENADAGTDSVQSAVTWTLGANLENLTLTGGKAINGTGNDLANSLVGNQAANSLSGGLGDDTLDGCAGVDTLAGGDGIDTFIFRTTGGGADKVLDFLSGSDKLQFWDGANGLKIGNGDHLIDQAVSRDASGGFATASELVIFTSDIAGTLTRAQAATAIGQAASAYAVGDIRLFAVDNGTDSAVYLFKAANADATVSAAELTLIGTLQGTAQTALTDYAFA